MAKELGCSVADEETGNKLLLLKFDGSSCSLHFVSQLRPLELNNPQRKEVDDEEEVAVVTELNVEHPVPFPEPEATGFLSLVDAF